MIERNEFYSACNIGDSASQSTMMYRAYIGYAWVNRILVGRDRLFIGSLLQNALHIAYISVNYV